MLDIFGAGIGPIVTVFLAVIFTALVASLIGPTIRRVRCIVKLKNYPSLPSHFFFGHLLQHPGPNWAGMKWGQEMMEKFKASYVLSYGFWAPTLSLVTPEGAKAVLRTSEPKPTKSGMIYGLLYPWLGHGLITSAGNRWFRDRRLLTPAFHFDVLRRYMPIYGSCVDILMRKLEEICRTQKSVDVFDPISQCSLDVILRCAMSYESNVQLEGKRNQYLTAVNELGDLALDRFFKPWLMNDFIYSFTANAKKYYKHCDYVHNLAHNLIEKRKAFLRDHPDALSQSKRVDFLDIMLSAVDEDGSGLTVEEIRENVDTFMFAGHDTTTSAISWILYNLARHPECQSKVREEIRSILADNPGHIEWEQVKEMEYLSLCIKESMRLHPPVPYISRHLTRDIEVEGRIAPDDSVIDVFICNLHHNPDHWGENHWDFIPERFELSNAKGVDPYAYVPFSAGPRNCIGQNFALNEIKVTVAKIIQNFAVRIDETCEVEQLPCLVLRAKNGIKLYFDKLNMI